KANSDMPAPREIKYRLNPSHTCVEAFLLSRRERSYRNALALSKIFLNSAEMEGLEEGERLNLNRLPDSGKGTQEPNPARWSCAGSKEAAVGLWTIKTPSGPAQARAKNSQCTPP